MKLLPRFSKIKQVILRSMLLRQGRAVKINVNEVELTIFIEYLKIKIYFN